MRCAIIDDEPLAHEVITTYLQDIPFIKLSGQFFRGTDAVAFLSNNEIDLIFLDIRMPKLNGLDLIRTLKHKPIIIVTSAFEEYALESFDLDVCDYLLKPFRFERMLKAVNRALDIYNLRKQVILPGKELQEELNKHTSISIRTDKKIVLVPVNELQYLESLGNYVKVWAEKEFLLAPRTLTSFEEQLPEDTFFRIHKSFIMNKNFVHYMEGNRIFLKNGTELPIGKNYLSVTKRLLNIEY